MPNASVIDGIEQNVAARQRPREIVAGLLANEDRVGQLLLEPRVSRSFADHQDAMLDLVRGESVDRVGEDVEALFHHHPAKEGDDHLVIGDAERTAPFHVAAFGIELIAVDASRPDRDVAVHALRAQDRRGRFGRGHDDFAAAVETAKDRAHIRLERLQMVISEIGLEAGVDRGHRGDLVLARPGDRAVADDVGAGNMDDVGIEFGEVALDPAGERDRRGDILRGWGSGARGY